MPHKITSAKFTVDNQVRVRFGVKDPDFSDIPLGGWVGKITDVEAGNPPTYLIRWNQQTITAMHPVFRNRSERDGLDFEEMWLGEDDLELDSGGAVVIEQPTKIVTRPLSMNDQDDRIRAVFGLTSDDVFPERNETNLRTYHGYLVANLTFPCAATFANSPEFGRRSEIVTILSLNGLDDDLWYDDSYGIMCNVNVKKRRSVVPLAELEELVDRRNAQIVADYSYWFWNH